MRIRIEMAFGRLVRKFGIIKSTMEGSLVKKAEIIMACARLHNFIILNDLTLDHEAIEDPEDAQIIPMPNAPFNDNGMTRYDRYRELPSFYRDQFHRVRERN